MTTFLSECNKHYFDLNTVNYVIIQENKGDAIFGVVREGHQSPYYAIKIEDFERLRGLLRETDCLIEVNSDTYIDGASVSSIVNRKGEFRGGTHDVFFANGAETPCLITVDDLSSLVKKIETKKKAAGFTI